MEEKKKETDILSIPIENIQRKIILVEERIKVGKKESEELGNKIQQAQSRMNEVNAHIFADARALMELNSLLKTE